MMRQVLSAGLALLVLTPALRALDEPPEKAKTPRERYQALSQEHQKAMRQFMDVYQKAKTVEERGKLVREKYPQPQSYTRRFLEIAESAPQDPAAVDALIWIVLFGSATPEANRAIDQLTTHHVASRKVGELAPNLVHSRSLSAEKLLRAILAKNPARDAKGQACLVLGQYLKQQSELVRRLKENPKLVPQLELGYKAQGGDSKGVLAQLLQKDPDASVKESEAMFERAAREFADVSYFRGTVGKTARAELHEIRNLGIGKLVPEISGEDIDGKSFQLSDYKGKVVVVDFWGDW